MKLIFATVTISCALPILNPTGFAQASGGAGGAGAGAASAASSGAIITGGRSAAIGAGAPVGAPVATPTSPTGSLAGTPGVAAAPSVNAPINSTAVPGTVTPIGPINPGGITATPPQTVGRTFDRSTIGGGPLDSTIDPNANQPTFRFPPASTPAQDVVTNSFGSAGTGTFPGSPVAVGNTVGTNFGGRVTSVPPEPVAVNLPPGARVVTNGFGVSEAIVPGPTIVATNAAGRGPTFESATTRSAPVPQRSAPPRNTPIR